MADVDIEFAIGATGTYTLTLTDEQNPAGVNVTGFTGGTITFTSTKDFDTSLGTATLINFGTPDNFSCQFTIPTTHTMTVTNKPYRDYAAQAVLTGSGTRATFMLSVRIHKKLGDAT
jgi:hypothetical protein